MKRRNATGLVIILVTTATLTGCFGRPEGTSSASGANVVDDVAETPPRLAVEALEVSYGNILQRIEASGTVEGINEATVISETQGIITFVDLELGAYVEKESPLAGVDDTILQLRYQEALGAFESAQLDLSAAQRRRDAGSASQAELTRAQSVADGAQARLRSIEKQYRDATVRAPISGYIASIGDEISIGSYLQPGVPVARIVDLSSLSMEIGVGEQELRYLRPGMEAKVSIPACGQTAVPALVQSIAAGADERTGSFPVRIVWENTCGENARSGIGASVTIETGDDERELVVPSAAIRTIGGKNYLFVVTGDVAERREVQVGERLGDRVQIVDGIAPGEIIVVTALTSLSDGTLVDATVTGRTGDVL